ncbi:XylR family transcriptional regulator [Planctomicrobium sp. SH661]|uniref:XylR family transcriptional regulator n=1 Tax=Planctomicrobium sp. SH661 TaxID=3448124 RepID=UPI003F5C08D2
MAGRAPRIALLIETSREFGRALLRGVMQYEREHGPWSIYFEPRGLYDAPPTWLGNWDVDGIIARISTEEVAQAVTAANVPVIDVRIGGFGKDFQQVGLDNTKMVHLAFDHLWDQGYRNFAFCGAPEGSNPWSEFRARAFEKAALHAGGSFSQFRQSLDGRSPARWDQDLDEIAQWLSTLPRPVGLLTHNDDRALQVLEAARRAEMKVPDELGVIGIDNDELLCNLANPPLSSVECGVERVGYRAAAELDRRISGKGKKQKRIELQPLCVIGRQSTNILVFPDEEMARLIRDLRANACDGVRVDALLEQSNLSESTIQRRFKQFVGRSMKEEITRIRMDRARELLTHSDLPVSEISERCGFTEPKQLSTVFHKKMGMTPMDYRRQNRMANFGGL